MSETETHVGTRGDAAEQIGFRNQLRARWQALPVEQRWAATIAMQLVLAIALWFVDHALGYAALRSRRSSGSAGCPACRGGSGSRRVVVLPSLISGPRSLAVDASRSCSRSSGCRTRYRTLAAPARRAPDRRLPTRSSSAACSRSRSSASFPDVATGVYMVVFMMMAVGLNIVVGYAGLLDLGYVAFYAIGAYTAAWFASLQFARRPATIALRRDRTVPVGPGRASTSRSGCCCSSPASSRRSSGS